MKILIAGANGMVGSAVAPYLASQGHEVARLVRRQASEGEVHWDPDAGSIDAAGLEGLDGVVNLATMPWPLRWNAEAKKKMIANRMSTNGLLARTLAACKRKPQVLVCASGMGIYPSSGDQWITEENPAGSDFLANLQCEGEAAAMQASNAGIRVVNLRIPPVLGGAMLHRSMGRIGSGQQWSSWIGRDELARIINFVLLNDELAGPVNPVSPNPLRNTDFAAIHSRVLGTKSGPAVPAFVIRLALGEMATALLLASRRIEPHKLFAAGYQFHFPELETALRHELKIAEGEI
jgi:uncharacterized protein (TIGR01777 family)